MREIAVSAGVGVGKYMRACIDEYVALIDTHRSLMEILLFRAQSSSLEHFRLKSRAGGQSSGGA